jgi:hypothetical protein
MSWFLRTLKTKSNQNPIETHKFRFNNPIIHSLKDETNLETILDTLVVDLDNDGEKEIVVVTYLGAIYVLKLGKVVVSQYE